MAKVSAVATHYSLPLIDHLARVGRRAAESAVEPGGLRPRHLVALSLLSDGPASQQGLAESLSLDPSNVVGLLNELEERGLITRRRDPVDRRRHIVELSDVGRTELDAAATKFASMEDELLGALSPEERETLYELLVRAAGIDSAQCAADTPSACTE